MDENAWLQRARKRLRSAEILIADSAVDDSAFMAHQAVEMAFKAVIAHRSGEMPPRIHELKILAGRVSYPNANEVVLLDPVYTGSRYPDAPVVEINLSRAQRLLKIATMVVQWSESQTK